MLNYRNKYFYIFIVTLVVSVALYFGVKHWTIKQMPFNDYMLQTVESINRECPKMIDEHTRLDEVMAIPPKAMIYNYTLVNIDMDDVNMNNVVPSLEEVLLKMVKESSDFEVFRANKATITYRYFDKEGMFMVKIDITPEMYLN